MKKKNPYGQSKGATKGLEAIKTCNRIVLAQMKITERKATWTKRYTRAIARAIKSGDFKDIIESLADRAIGLVLLREKGYAPEGASLEYTVAHVPRMAPRHSVK